MSSAQSKLNEKVYIEHDQSAEVHLYKTWISSVSGLSLIIFDRAVELHEGWLLIRERPDGGRETHHVIDADFNPGPYNISPHPCNLRLCIAQCDAIEI